MKGLINIQVLSILFLININAQCNLDVFSFKSGEKLKFNMSYSLAPWLTVGYVDFSVYDVRFKGQDLYNIYTHGYTNESWDWFFEVNDVYQSLVDKKTVKPVYFKRDVDEDGYIIDNKYDFDWYRKKAYSKNMSYNSNKHDPKPYKKKEIDLTDCTFDVVSAIYYARNIDLTNVSVNQKIPMDIIMDNEIYTVYFKYLGKDKTKIRNLGRFNSLKFSVYVIGGDVFKDSGESLYLWVTDDKNRMPLKVKTPIVVGSVEATIASYKGLKNPLNSKIK